MLVMATTLIGEFLLPAKIQLLAIKPVEDGSKLLFLMTVGPLLSSEIFKDVAALKTAGWDGLAGSVMVKVLPLIWPVPVL